MKILTFLTLVIPSLQLSWVEQSLQNPNIFSFADHVTRLTNVDVLKQPLDEDNRELLTW